MRAYRLVALLSLLAPAAGAQVPDSQPAPDTHKAQTAAEPPRGARWRTSWFPYLTGGANDGPVLTLRVRHWQPAEYEARTTHTAAFNADAGIAPEGSRFVSASFKAPGLWDGWRLAAQAVVERQARYGYFGLGNETTYDKNADSDAVPFPYRVRRTRYRGAHT